MFGRWAGALADALLTGFTDDCPRVRAHKGALRMTLPSWFLLLLDHWNISVDDVQALLTKLLAEADLSDSKAAQAIADFLASLHVNLSPAALLAVATAAWEEIKGGKPGYWRDHGGVA